MKESVGYTVTLNIIIIFLVVIFTFLSATLIYFKSNKISNNITNSIEKYEGYNNLSEEEILIKLSSIGYNVNKINCSDTVKASNKNSTVCNLVKNDRSKEINSAEGSNGYCVYLCDEGDYYYYKIRTNMMLNIPIINNLLNIPIFSNTNRLYDFEEILD